MNEFFPVEIVDCLCDLSEEELGLLFVEFAPCDHVLEQLSSPAVLHYEDDLHVGEGETVQDLHDVLVVH